MKNSKPLNYSIIERDDELLDFHHAHANLDWLCFDTEFVGEKRFITRLCLIQVSSSKGNFLIDPFGIEDLGPFLELIEDPSILKVTHAGDNDYRLLNTLFGTVPSNTFDTQIASGFIGYKYPISFRKLVEGELKKSISKGYAVTDWEKRPFQKKQLRYALNDVIPLYDLWQMLERKLLDLDRLSWVKEEFQLMEEPAFYYQDPNKEALSSNLMKSLSPKEQLFLIRLYSWRRDLAEEKNYSKEMILPGKMITHIVRGIGSGKEAIKQNRRIPDKIVSRYGDLFEEFYEKERSEAEEMVLSKIQIDDKESPKEGFQIEFLYMLIKYLCLEKKVSPNLVIQRNNIKKLKYDSNFFIQYFKKTWRNEFLGQQFLDWLQNYDQLEVNILPEKIEFSIDRKNGRSN